MRPEDEEPEPAVEEGVDILSGIGDNHPENIAGLPDAEGLESDGQLTLF